MNLANLIFSGTLGCLYGIVVISGTGTISLGFNKNGERTRSSGWGPLLGDDGSGYQISFQALKAVVQQHDKRGPPTKLTEAILGELKISNPEVSSLPFYPIEIYF